MKNIKESTRERFWSKVKKGSGCWEWVGAIAGTGYGSFRATEVAKGGYISSHRLGWILHHGPIRSGAFVLHKCDNRKCVRPAHLFLGTHSDNMKDCVAKGRWKNQNTNKTHCPKGHKYDYFKIKGERRCSTCNNERWRAYYARTPWVQKRSR